MNDKPQWIGDRLRSIAGKRDPNTVSDTMMMLRSLGPTPPMACTWNPEQPRKNPRKTRGGWVPFKPASLLPKTRNTDGLRLEMRAFAKAFVRLEAVSSVEITDENQTARAYAAYRRGALTDTQARILGVHDNAIRVHRKQLRNSKSS